MQVMEFLMGHFLPNFQNLNDASITSKVHANYTLMAISVVILVPLMEEVFFRGLIFRKLYGKNRFAAYLVSILAFSCIHILGYIGVYSPLELIMAVLEYLPAGIWLAWSYTKADTIFAPILIHAAVNYVTINGLR